MIPRRTMSSAKLPLMALGLVVGLALTVFVTLALQVRELDMPSQHQGVAESLSYRVRYELAKGLAGEPALAVSRLGAEQKNLPRSFAAGEYRAFTTGGEFLVAYRSTKGDTSVAKLDPKTLVPARDSHAVFLLTNRGTVVASRSPGKNEAVTLPPALRKAITSESQKAGFLRLQEKNTRILAAFHDIPGTNLTILVQSLETSRWNAFLRHSLATLVTGAILLLCGVVLCVVAWRHATALKRENTGSRRARKQQQVQMTSLRNLQIDLKDATSREECFLMFSIALSHLDLVADHTAPLFLIRTEASSFADHEVVSFVKTENGDTFLKLERAPREFVEVLNSEHHRIVERLHRKWRCWLWGPEGAFGFVEFPKRTERAEKASEHLVLLETMAQATATALLRLPHLAAPQEVHAAPSGGIPAEKVGNVRSIRVPQRADLRVSRLTSENGDAPSAFGTEEETQAIPEGEVRKGVRAA